MTTDRTGAKPGKQANATSRAKRVTKKDQLIRMLGTSTGTDVATISDKLCWQTHTTRAAITGLRKAGYVVISEAPGQGKPARYRIVNAPADMAKAAPADEHRETVNAG